jgi:hypothetical protein
MMNLNRRRRTATVIAWPLLCGLAAAVSLGPLAGAASAASSPTISAPSSTGNTSLPVAGSGFAPGGQVHLEVDSGTAVVSSTNVVASEPSSSFVCVYGVKPVCHQVTIPGGQFQTTVALSILGCGVIADGILKATDLSTGSIANESIWWEGMC